jgi:hypothetical protein
MCGHLALPRLRWWKVGSQPRMCVVVVVAVAAAAAAAVVVVVGVNCGWWWVAVGVVVFFLGFAVILPLVQCPPFAVVGLLFCFCFCFFF